jgi:glycosyltransferase involved in cell wall biosynthesis
MIDTLMPNLAMYARSSNIYFLANEDEILVATTVRISSSANQSNPMEDIRVAVDAFRLIAEPHTSGAVMVSEIVRQLHRHAAIAQISLVLPRKPDSDFQFGDLLNIAHVATLIPRQPCFPEKGFVRNLHWIQVVIPGILKTADISYFIAPYHQTPVFLRRSVRVLTIINDICGLLPSAGYVYYKTAVYRHWFNILTALQRADGFAYISAYTKGTFERAFPNAKRRPSMVIYPKPTISFLAPGDRGRAEALSAHGLSAKGYFFAMGASGIRKGQDLTQRAFELYRSRGGRNKLALLVPEAAARNLKGTAAASSDSVVLLHDLSNADRDAIYSGAIALLFPSRCEGFGYPVLEALVQGCPPIALRHSPANEIVGECAPLLETLDENEIVDMMLIYEAMTSASREQMAARLSAHAESFVSAIDAGNRFASLMQDIGG